jgi:hypothetical protein
MDSLFTICFSVRQIPVLFCAICIFAGCAPGRNLVPLSEDGQELYSPGAAPVSLSKEWEYLAVTVQPAPRSQVPSDVRRQFTVMEVSVHNRGQTEAVIRLDQFALVDSTGVQSSPMSPEDVDRSLDQSLYPTGGASFSMGYSRYHGYNRGHYYRGRWFPDPYPYAWRYYGWGIPDPDPLRAPGSPVFQPAFQGGPVAPGARKQGWLYFNKVDEVPGRKVELLFMVEGKIRLIFPMMVVENR